MRVIYDTTVDCIKCPYNTGRVCMKLGKYLFDVCFETDCPLPELSDVEQFTRYVTKDKGLECHGNCRNWERWQYNKHLNTDLGLCRLSGDMKICHANGPSCEDYKEV